VLTFGTPEDKWDADLPILKVMGRFELPDLAKMSEEAAAQKTPDCLSGMSGRDATKLGDYMSADGPGNPDLLTVGSMGNERTVLGPDFFPFHVAAMAAVIKANAKYKPGMTVVLDWPWSAAGKSPVASELHKLLGNKVIGADGPLWWYPDGTKVVTKPEQGLQWPSAANISTCMGPGGAVLAAEDCKKLAATLDHRKAVFGNTLFVPDSCADLGTKAMNAQLGDAGEAFSLYFYYEFVRHDHARALTYLMLAANRQMPKAEYFAAEEVRETQKGAYLDFLRRAAKHGIPQAAKELAADGADKPAP
jgi:hypothetical protein